MRANAQAVGFPRADVVAGEVATVLRRRPPAPYDVAFLDPPYAVSDDDVAEVLGLLVEHDWLTPGALVVLERSSRGAAPAWPEGLWEDRGRKYGETTLHYATRGR